MQVLIEIPNEYYEIIKHDVNNGMDYRPCVLIAKGTPLPKGHGRLIDADAFYNDLIFPNVLFAKSFKEMLDDAETIIEAESEEQ